MIVEDQSEVETFLSDPATHCGAAVERIDTHGAIVFLAGDRAYKLKRAVHFDFLDYATPARRRAMCEAEIAINRRTAPQVYRTVIAVTRGTDGALSLDGSGTPVDWVVAMNRFDQGTLFDRLAGRHALTLTHMDDLAEVIADFHSRAEARHDFGGAEAMQGVLNINSAAVKSFKTSVFEPAQADDLIALSEAALTRNVDLLERRGKDGFVRHLHGDLHLRNICLIGGRPVIFDATEFNDRLAICDVWYDFAFLLMDLNHRGLRRHANRVFNDYLWHTGDIAGLALLPFFVVPGGRACPCRRDCGPKPDRSGGGRGHARRGPRLSRSGGFVSASGSAPLGGGRRGIGNRKICLGKRSRPVAGASAGCGPFAHRPDPQTPDGRRRARTAGSRGLHGAGLEAGLRIDAGAGRTNHRDRPKCNHRCRVPARR